MADAQGTVKIDRARRWTTLYWWIMPVLLIGFGLFVHSQYRHWNPYVAPLRPDPQYLLVCFNNEGKDTHRSLAEVYFGADFEYIEIRYTSFNGGKGFMQGKRTGLRTYSGKGNQPGWTDGRFTLTMNEYGTNGDGRWWTPGSVDPRSRQGGALQLIRQ